MRVVNRGNRSARTVFAEQAGNEFVVSPFEEARNGYRPIGRFDSKEELEAYVASKRCVVQWLDN